MLGIHHIRILLPLLFLAGILALDQTGAHFVDAEVSNENSWNALWINIESAVVQASADERTVSIENTGPETLKYSVSAIETGDSAASFCADTVVNVERNDVTVYNGPLLGFSLATSPLEASAEDSFEYTFSVDDESQSYALKSCEVEITYAASQTKYVFGTAFYDIETDNIALSGANFGILPPPAPPVLFFIESTASSTDAGVPVQNASTTQATTTQEGATS